MTDNNDVVYTYTGNDRVTAGGGNDVVYGGTGNDTLDGGSGIDFLFGEEGDDSIQGGAGDDYIEGGVGNDSLMGGRGDDMIFGGAGSDTFLWQTDDGTDDFIEHITDSGSDILVIQGTTDIFVVRDGNHLAVGTGGNDWAYITNWYVDKGMDWVNIGNRNYSTETIASMATYTAANTLSLDDGHVLSTEGLTAIDFTGVPQDAFDAFVAA